MFPFYLSIGMTYEQFWEQDVELVKFYREAWKLKQEQQNYNAWLQGMYVYEAVCDASPIFHDFAKKGTKAHPYPTKPYERFKSAQEIREEKEQKSDQKAKELMQAWMVNINKKFQKKGGEQTG